MQNIFKYVPWFKDLSLRISEMSQEELFAKADQVDWGSDSRALVNYQKLGPGSVDPFSFLRFLAHRRHNSGERKNIFQSVHDWFDVAASLPKFDEQEETIFPGPSSGEGNLLFHQATPETMQLDEIRTLFGQAVRSQNHVQADDFEAIRSGKGSEISSRKLTSTLHLVNPHRFPVYPLKRDYFDISEKYCKHLSWENYRDFINEEKKKFPGCEPYETYRIRLWCNDREVDLDFASEFIIHNVRDEGEWQRIRDDRQFESQAQRDCNKGAIVLFHLKGSSKALGIGAVYGNGFGTMQIEEGKVNVLWLGKETRDLGTNEPSEDTFREVYGDTFRFIDQAKNRKRSTPTQVQDKSSKAYTASNTEKGALNRILYGPPGTGKTYKARELAEEIIAGGQKEGQITMVTFHQSYSYEDFVEGIRPVLGEQAGDVKYTMKKGTFRVICDNAKKRPDAKFVLIIDEINRGNIAKIFGELITLIEDSKRAGAENALPVKLPYSEEELEVPKNLYIIGTMNTADRSIALLDTALRRRFTFEEMMPKHEHELIPKNIDGIDCQKLLKAINKRITKMLDREKQIGHTYLLDLKSLEDLKSTFQHKICPLLSEYFYDDWDKIEKILGGNALVNGEQQQWTPSNEPAWDAPESYIAIYNQNT